MALKTVADGLYILPCTVNIYLLNAPEGLTLIDVGFPGNETKVLDALEALDRLPSACGTSCSSARAVAVSGTPPSA